MTWGQYILEWWGPFFARYGTLMIYLGAPSYLATHFMGEGRRVSLLLLLFLLPAAVGLFFVLAYAPEPISLARLTGILLMYGAGLFILLSELMVWGLARFLTSKRGDKWTKEMDYVYLTIGAAG